MTEPKGILNREITTKEASWLAKDYPKGTKLTEFCGCTYGCIGKGIACVFEGETAFQEVPRDAITLEVNYGN